MASLFKQWNDPKSTLEVQRYFGVRSKREILDENNPDLNKYKTRIGKDPKQEWVATNYFWYYLFVLGTELGDENFYSLLIPFWFWNVDGAVGRRFVMVWTIVMYIGQSLKDVLCWERPPSPPVFRLQTKWSQEYGMPSTHAMVGVSIPFSIVLYTSFRYQYPFLIGVVAAIISCVVISLSRVYLGMHSIADVVAGLILAVIIMIPTVPLVDALDMYFLSNKWSPIILFGISSLLLLFYPHNKMWTTTKTDTTIILSVCVGIHVGAWVNYQMGQMIGAGFPPPYSILFPTYRMMGLTLLRTLMGLICIVATKVISKSAFLYLNLIGGEEDPSSGSGTKMKIICCYLTYFMIGFGITYLFPCLFKWFNIERPTFYTEI